MLRAFPRESPVSRLCSSTAVRLAVADVVDAVGVELLAGLDDFGADAEADKDNLDIDVVVFIVVATLDELDLG